MLWRHPVLTIVAIFPLAGCGYSALSDRQTNPAIQGMTWGSASGPTIEYIATTASRRLIVVNDNEQTGIVQLCTEPPPDVGEAFSAAFAAGLQAAVQEGDDTMIGIAGQTARQAATAIAPLLYRTQGLQLYRDVQWGLCNDLLSGFIAMGEYLAAKKMFFDRAAKLIDKELIVMKEAQVEFFKNSQVASNLVSVDTVTKILEAVKPSPAQLPSKPASSEQKNSEKK